MPQIVEDRSLGIGGSDVAAILGLSRWTSARQLYHEKRGELPPPEFDDERAERLYWGKAHESTIAVRFAEKTGRKIRRQKKTLFVKSKPYIRANIDRWQFDKVKGKGVLEIKAVDFSQRRVWVNEGVPEPYYLQLQHYLMVTGCQWGSFAVLFGGNKLEIFDVERDQDVIIKLIQLETKFWECVMSGTPPDHTFDALGKDVIRRLYPQQKPGTEMILDSPEAVAKARRMIQLDETIKRREEEFESLKTWFMAQIGDAEKALVPNTVTFTWKYQASNRINLKRLKDEQPEIAQKYTEAVPSRVFRKQVQASLAADLEEAGETTLPDEIITGGVTTRVIRFEE